MSRHWITRTIARHERAILAGALVLLLGAFAFRSELFPEEDDARITTVSAGDVHRFAAAFARRTPGDTTCAYLEPFLRDASSGQDAYLSKFAVDRRSLCQAIRRDSGAYLRLASGLPVIDSVVGQISLMLNSYAVTLTPPVVPDVFFVVGNGIFEGTTTPSRHPRILIGAERLPSADSLRWTVLHEFAHTQQIYSRLVPFVDRRLLIGASDGTLLHLSIMEGSADFVAEQLTGIPYHNAYGEQHAAELWEEFRRDMHGRDYSRWLYNDANRAALGDRPPDLGHFIGYSIAKAYDDNPKYKGRAFADVMDIRDFDRFVEMSGYNPSAHQNPQ